MSTIFEIDIPDDFYIEFDQGQLAASVDSHYGSDYGGSFELTKEQTLNLYKAMHAYFTKTEDGK